MEHRKHYNLARLNLVEDRVRKTPHDGTADIFEHLRVQLWRGDDPIQDILYTCNEIHTEPRSLLLIPIKRFVELGPSFLP